LFSSSAVVLGDFNNDFNLDFFWWWNLI
jgi:hypothetical protein